MSLLLLFLYRCYFVAIDAVFIAATVAIAIRMQDGRLHLGVGHAGGVPVEGRAQVVGEHLVGHRLLDLRGELRRLLAKS